MATQAKRDYYEVLGVTRTATEQEIKSAFKDLVAEFRSAGKPRTIQEVEEIRNLATAYRVLSDTEKRRLYDRSGCCFPGDTKLTADGWAKKAFVGDADLDSGEATALVEILAGM